MSEKDYAYQRTGFVLAGFKDEPDLHTPYYPPIPEEDYASFPDLYRTIIPYEWTGDLAAIRELTVSMGENLIADPNHPERIWVDAGIINQLRRCGYDAVHWGACPTARDERLHTFERRIQENRRRTMNVVGTFLSAVASVVSFVPVLGQGVAVVLTAAAAVATRKPIDAALVDGVIGVLPGGPAVRTAAAPAVELGRGIVSGDAAEEILISTARKLAVSGAGDDAGLAFDLVLAVARGEDLQSAGFALVHRWLPGQGLAQKGALFGVKLANAAARGESVERVILREAKTQLDALPIAQKAQAEVDRAVDVLLTEPRRYLGSAEALAKELRMPVEAARAAFMSVRRTSDGKLVEHPSFRMALVDPRAPIQGESASRARVERWAKRKLALRELTFEAARGPSYSKHLAARSSTATFSVRGRTLVAYESPYVDEALAAIEQERSEFEALARAIEAARPRAETEEKVYTMKTDLERAGVVVLSRPHTELMKG